MATYETRLVSGSKPPYDSWAFAPVPDDVRRALGGGARIAVCGEVAGVAFRSTVQKGDGVYRFPVTRAVREAAGVGVGDLVEVRIDVDTASREVPVPTELRAALDAAKLWQRFTALPPAHRRAWCEHVAEAKQPATRARRAAKAPAAIRSKLFPGQR